MNPIYRFRKTAILVLALTSSALDNGCGGGTTATPPPVVAVSISPSSATVSAGSTQALTATIQNDSAKKGVTWALSPATGAGTLSNVTSTSVIYNPPATPPASALSVTITATSVADSTKFASSAITVPGPVTTLTVAVTPATATVQPGASAPFTATVTNDPANAGVTWNLSCSPAVSGEPGVSACGNLSSMQTQSGIAATYTAPISGDLNVTLTAATVTDGSVIASAVIRVPGIAVTVSPFNVTIQVGSSGQLTAIVANDSANKGVSWALSYVQNGSLVDCPSATVCGSVSPTSTASGVATTYTAPTAPPAGDLEVALTATSVANTAASAQGFVIVPGIKVSIAPNTATVAAGTTTTFTATVTDDPSNKGVTWTVSCPSSPCGSISPATTASGIATTYTAPPTAPVGNLSVTITAASVTNSAASSTATATVPAISVSISPASALIPLNITQQFTATVSNDPNTKSVAWTLTQGGTPCDPACGNVSPVSTSSGNPTTYTAPANLPSTTAVTLVATSATDATKTANATITLTTGTVRLVPDSMSFGRVLVHRSALPQLATLTNTGTSILNLSSIGISGTSPQDYSQTNTCGPSVNAGTSCTISVTFTPSAFGTRSASVSITDSSTDSPQLISLTGIGYTSFPRRPLAVSSALLRSSAVTVPSPTGPFTVGTRVLDLTDTTRDDPYLSDGTKREIAVRLWYPASLSQPCKPAEYTSPAVWEYFSQLTNVRPFRVNTNSCVNAPFADAPHPVVVFTPGYTATFTDYTFLLEDLASRGYVVASVDHTYEATAVEFPDGRLAKSVLGSHLGNTWRGDEKTFSSATQVRLQDFEFVLNELGRLNAQPGGPFASRLDMSKVAIAGHSMGGMAALLSLRLEARFQAGVILDSAVPEALASGTNKPLFILAAGRSQWDAGECRLWKNLLGPRLAANFAGTEHAAFSDWVWLADTEIETGPMGPEKAMAAMRDYVAAFLDASLRQKSPNRLLTGPSPDYPDVTLTTQQQSLCPEK